MYDAALKIKAQANKYTNKLRGSNKTHELTEENTLSKRTLNDKFQENGTK